MSPSDTVQSRGGRLIVFSLSIGLLALHVGHAFLSSENLLTLFSGILIPMGLTVALLAGGIWLWIREDDVDNSLHIGAWCVGGAAVMSAAAVLTILYEQGHGVYFEDRLFVVANGASGGAATGFLVGVYDSRRRRAKAKTNRLNRRLTVLNRVLRHDIRNKASVIQSNAELLTANEPDIHKRAKKIQQQVEEISELSEGSRKIHRVLQSTDTDRDVIDITTLIETCCERIRRDESDAEIDVSLPETQLVVAHQLVDSALTNVIENAVEHNDKQTPQVTIESAQVSHNGTEYVELRIADNGPGIPETELDALESGYETALTHTSGLGLWLVQWIVTESGGNIRFEDNDPNGSVVRLQFECGEAGATRTASSSRGGAVGQPA